MIRDSIKKGITITVIVVLLLVVIPILFEQTSIYKFFSNIGKDNTTELYGPTRIEEIKQMVKLNSLNAYDEIVFKDTIDDLYVVYDINVHITIGFDVEHMRHKVVGDMLYIELPKPIVKYYQNDKERLLDIYQIGLGGKIYEWTNIGSEPNLTATQSMRLRGKMAQYIDYMVKERGYEERAKEMAMHNLANLFYAIRGNVSVVEDLDLIDAGQNEIEYDKK